MTDPKRGTNSAATSHVRRTSHTQFLTFIREELPGRVTPVVRVQSRRSGALLGTISWYGPWRQFCFWPQADTIFNVGCMDDIQAKIGELRGERAA